VLGSTKDGDRLIPFKKELTVAVFTPEMVSVSPGVALWRLNSEPKEKVIKFEVKQADKMHLAVKGDDLKGFSYTWQEIFPGRAYELRIRPVDTAESKRATLTIDGTTETDRSYKFFCHVLVK
jgi:hypothetical protein